MISKDGDTSLATERRCGTVGSWPLYTVTTRAHFAFRLRDPVEHVRLGVREPRRMAHWTLCCIQNMTREADFSGNCTAEVYYRATYCPKSTCLFRILIYPLLRLTSGYSLIALLLSKGLSICFPSSGSISMTLGRQPASTACSRR